MATANQSYVVPPEDLNNLFDALGATYDKYYNSLTKPEQDFFKKLFSDWQNWFFAEENYDNWASNKISEWNTLYGKAIDYLLKIVQERALQPEEVVNSTPGEVIKIEEPTIIYGNLPKHNNWPWISAVIGSVLLGAIYSK